MIVPVMAISNLVLTRQIYSEETNGAHAHYREPVPLKKLSICTASLFLTARLAVQIQSFFNLQGQNGHRVTKVYSKQNIYRGYYTVEPRYEFYFRVAKQYDFTNERSE